MFSWIFSCLMKADKNKDDKLTQSEVKDFFSLINIEIDDNYAEMLFQVMILFLMVLNVENPSCRTSLQISGLNTAFTLMH